MANSNEAAAEAAPTPRGSSAWPAVLAILIALIAIGIAGFSAWQFTQVSYVPGALNSATADFAGLEAQLERLSDTQADQQEAIRDLEALLDQAVARIEDVPLTCSHAEALHGTAVDLRAQAQRMQHRAAVADAEITQDLELARLQIQLDLDEADTDPGDDTLAIEVVLCDTNEPRSGKTFDR